MMLKNITTGIGTTHILLAGIAVAALIVLNDGEIPLVGDLGSNEQDEQGDEQMLSPEVM